MSAENRPQDFIYEDWNKVRSILQQPQSAVRASATDDGDQQKTEEEVILRNYLGDEKFEVLRGLSTRSQNIREKIGHVILLPGIMGSHLTVIEKDGRDRDHVWLNYWRIVKGDLDRLEIDRASRKNRNGETVEASGLLGSYYGLALEMLQADPFPYDWRLEVQHNAGLLAAAVERKLGSAEFKPEDKLSFVAHSMGGLVVRSFIQQFPDLWKRAGGNLIMLGTPNSGAFAAVKGLMGGNETAAKLALIDFFHDGSEINRIINTFYGLYQLCPSKLVNPEVYEETLWRSFPDVWFNDYLLLDVPKLYQSLFDAQHTTIDKDRMVYIAGSGFETPASLKRLDDGGYDFEITEDGDGTVPHSLGLLPGVTTYYTDEAAHADLPDNIEVIEAVRDVLEKGETHRLNKQKPVTARRRFATRSGIADTELLQAQVVAAQIRELYEREMRKSGSSEITEDTLREVRSKANLSESVVRDAERKLVKSLLGGNFDSFAEDFFEVEPPQSGTPQFPQNFQLDFELRRRSITATETAAALVGLYQDVPPKGAISFIDKIFAEGGETGWIANAQKNGMFGADVGQLFFIPVVNRRGLKANAVIVGGLGKYHSFNEEDLRYLMMNAVLGVLTLGNDSLATVLIGTNAGKLSDKDAIRSILYGAVDALKRMPELSIKKFKIEIVEYSPSRFNEAQKFFIDVKKSLEEDEELKGLTINFDADPKASSAEIVSFIENQDKQNQDKRDQTNKETETRLTILRNQKSFSLSAVTTNATIPMRRLDFQNFIVDSLIEKLRTCSNPRKQTNYGRLMHSLTIPQDLQSYIDSNESLVLQLNREAAAIPWELIKYGGKRGTKSFGIDLKLTRQFLSSEAPAPTVPPPLNNHLKVLIIADPASGNLQLPGARLEGEQLRDFFVRLAEETGDYLTIDLHTRIGSENCDIVDVLALINSEEFDLIHFAGHGVYEEEPKSELTTRDEEHEPKARGWVFGRNPDGSLLVLSAREIFRIHRVPRLVFANACFSSVLGARDLPEKLSTAESTAKLAGIAEAFFLRGIENYIGAGWEVNDIYAIDFAKTFYRHALANQSSFSEALKEARIEIAPSATFTPNDTTWGAYQHYGDANAKLVDFQRAGKAATAKPAAPAEDNKTNGAKKKSEKQRSSESEEKQSSPA